MLENSEKMKVEVQQENTSGFVIKSRSEEKKEDILCKIELKQLIEKYPFLSSMEEVRKPLLIITEQAEREIKEHIQWGTKTDRNVCEQGGILIGKPFLIDDIPVSVAECIIPAEVSYANSAYLEMGTDTWTKMLNIYDENYKEKGWYIVGWFHTHPNSLAVFMSSTDRGTQYAMFNQKWHFSLVLNPHRHLAACFNSADADVCNYYSLTLI